VQYSGTTFSPEAGMRESGIFLQRAVAAETEQKLVDRGEMPYYQGGCYGRRCWRHYQGVGPRPGGRFDRASAEQEETSGGETGDSDEELEELRRERDAAREEAKAANREKDAALDSVRDLTDVISNGQ
jgi:hypothetical protein